MAYLKQFARNQRIKENTIVLTARLPESLYGVFKTYCDQLGLSISEAVCLLVEREVTCLQSESEIASTFDTDVYQTNDDVVVANTEKSEENTNVVKTNTSKGKSNTVRFTTNHWKVNEMLPCPICGEWKAASNFSRHAKQHDTTTEEIFTNKKYQEKIEAMIEEKR
jgi:antitoxin component of RelBE/YafQ-DinJ toxin-antitoxin module